MVIGKIWGMRPLSSPSPLLDVILRSSLLSPPRDGMYAPHPPFLSPVRPQLPRNAVEFSPFSFLPRTNQAIPFFPVLWFERRFFLPGFSPFSLPSRANVKDIFFFSTDRVRNFQGAGIFLGSF